MLSLSDHVFLGGFCATDALPVAPWEELEHEGRRYRAKKYREGRNATAGVNRNAWFFHADDLLRFFTERGWKTQVLTDEETSITAGRYLRFLAMKS